MKQVMIGFGSNQVIGDSREITAIAAQIRLKKSIDGRLRGRFYMASEIEDQIRIKRLYINGPKPGQGENIFLSGDGVLAAMFLREDTPPLLFHGILAGSWWTLEIINQGSHLPRFDCAIGVDVPDNVVIA